MAKSKSNPLESGMIRDYIQEIPIDKNRRIPIVMKGSIKDIQDLLLQIEQAFPNHCNFRFEGYSNNTLTADRPETAKETAIRIKREDALRLANEKRAKTNADRKAKREAAAKLKREEQWRKLKEEFGDK